MSETFTLPVLPLDDEVVLPGMVVPIETSQPEVGAAIDAARMPSRQGPGVRSEVKARVLLVPRLPDRGLEGVGTLAVVEQVGRLPGGEPGAGPAGCFRSKIGSGTTGPGAALWVEATEVEETGRGPRADELGQGVQVPDHRDLAAARRVAGHRHDHAARRRLRDRRPGRIRHYLTAAQKLQLLKTANLVERLDLVIGWTREHLAELNVAESIRKDVAEGMEKPQRSSCCASSSLPSARSCADLNGDPATEETTTGPGSRPRTSPRRARGRAEGSRQAGAGPGRCPPRPAGSAPGWTPCSTFHGTTDRGLLRHGRGAAHPRRGSHRAG